MRSTRSYSDVPWIASCATPWLTTVNPIDYAPCINVLSFDAVLIDWRGELIACPEDLRNLRTTVVLALIDGNLSLSVTTNETAHEAPAISGSADRLELVTAQDLCSAVINLRISARKLPPVTLYTPDHFPLSHQTGLDNVRKLRECGYHLLHHFLNLSSDCIVIKDLEHRFIAASDVFAKAHQLPLEQIFGKNELEIGTEEELVLGNPERGWKG